MAKIPYDIARSKFLGNSFGTSAQDPFPTSVFFSPDGFKMFIVGEFNNSVSEYNLTISFDITTASFSGNSFDTSAQDTDTTSVFFSPDGFKMFIVGSVSNLIHEYNLTASFDITTVSFSGNSFDASPQETDTISVFFSPDGFKMFIVGSVSNLIHEYNLTASFDITTVSFSGNSFDASANISIFLT